MEDKNLSQENVLLTLEPASMWRDCERTLQTMLSETTEPYPIPPSRENKNDVE
jgi:hypothetical protein